MNMMERPFAPPPGGEPLLEATGLCAWYGAAQILFDVDLTVRRGEVVALMGRNGAGKSTTLKAVMGLMAKRRGTVRFAGRDISAGAPHDIARSGLGFVPEDRRIFTDLTVTENLEVGRQPPRAWPDGSPAPHWTAARRWDLRRLLHAGGPQWHRSYPGVTALWSQASAVGSVASPTSWPWARCRRMNSLMSSVMPTSAGPRSPPFLARVAAIFTSRMLSWRVS